VEASTKKLVGPGGTTRRNLAPAPTAKHQAGTGGTFRSQRNGRDFPPEGEPTACFFRRELWISGSVAADQRPVRWIRVVFARGQILDWDLGSATSGIALFVCCGKARRRPV